MNGTVLILLFAAMALSGYSLTQTYERITVWFDLSLVVFCISTAIVVVHLITRGAM